MQTRWPTPVAVPPHVTYALDSPVGDVNNAIGAQRQAYGGVEPHAALGAAAHVMALVIGPAADRLSKHRDPLLVDVAF